MKKCLICGNKFEKDEDIEVMRDDDGYYTACAYCRTDLMITYDDELLSERLVKVLEGDYYTKEGELEEKAFTIVSALSRYWRIKGLEDYANQCGMLRVEPSTHSLRLHIKSLKERE